MEWKRDDGYLLSDEKRLLDFAAVCRLLENTYWAAGRRSEVMACAIENSLCIGLFHDGRQVGFARAVSDYSTFTWVCDVIIGESHRGRGLGRWMVQSLIDHPLLQTRSQLLATRDAHGLYEPFGFKRIECLKRLPGNSIDISVPNPPTHTPDITAQS